MFVPKVSLNTYEQDLKNDLIAYLQNPSSGCSDYRHLNSLWVAIGRISEVEEYRGYYPLYNAKEALINSGCYNEFRVAISSNFIGNPETLKGRKVAILTNLQPNCQSGNQSALIVMREDEGKEIDPIEPSSLLLTRTYLAFNEQDLVENEANVRTKARLWGVCTTLFFWTIAHFSK